MGHARVIWRGEIYAVDLGQPIGHEPAFRRPAVVVSVDIVNNGPGDLIIAVPVTTVGYGLRSHVELEPEATGLDHLSYARCDQVRVVSTRRLIDRHGAVAPGGMHDIDRALRFILDL